MGSWDYIRLLAESNRAATTERPADSLEEFRQ